MLHQQTLAIQLLFDEKVRNIFFLASNIFCKPKEQLSNFVKIGNMFPCENRYLPTWKYL
jgi:hypothetical protein